MRPCSELDEACPVEKPLTYQTENVISSHQTRNFQYGWVMTWVLSKVISPTDQSPPIGGTKFIRRDKNKSQL